jgi:alginate O-acetyltransferase complex protein AlgJ
VAHQPQQLPAVHEAWLPREHALHRPRHGGKQLTALISALVFFATPTLLWVVGARPAEIENHRLAGFPSMAQGWAFFTSLPTWATDQLTFRAAAIGAADAISQAIFGESAPRDEGPSSGAGPLPGSPPGGGEPGEQSSPADQAGYRQVIEGKNGWLYFGTDAEAKCAPTHPLEDSLARIAQLKTIVESSGRKFVWIVPPDKSTMVPQFLPSSYPGKDCHQAAEAPTWAQLDAAGAMDVRTQVQQSATQLGRPIYPPNDTHWTDEGGMIMTRAVADAVQPGVTRTWQSTAVGSYTVPADLPPLLGRRGDKTNLLYDLRPDGVTDRAGKISVIDTPVTQSLTPLTGTVDKKTLVYGDSFTMASSRYLVGAFSNLTMLAYSTNKTSQSQAIDAFVNSEVVVLETVERNVSGGALPFFNDGLLNELRTQLTEHPVR